MRWSAGLLQWVPSAAVSGLSAALMVLLVVGCKTSVPVDVPPRTECSEQAPCPAGSRCVAARCEEDGASTLVLGEQDPERVESVSALEDASQVGCEERGDCEACGAPCKSDTDCPQDSFCEADCCVGNSEDVTAAHVPANISPSGCQPWEDIALGKPTGPAPELPYGVMSAAPREHSVVIWTRTDQPAKVRVAYTLGPQCEEQRTNWTRTSEEGALMAQIRLTDLAAGRWYRYRVEVKDRGDGHYAWFSTAPSDDRPFRFAFTADISQKKDLYGLFDDVAESGAEFNLFLGDWPYADSGTDAVSVEEYREKHLETRDDPAIHRLMAAMPTIAIWDDHELKNDWDGVANVEEPERVAAAKRVWHEFFPIEDAPKGELYRTFKWGSQVEFFLVDLRSHRDANSAKNGPDKTMMGKEQREWLQKKLTASDAKVKFLCLSVPLVAGTTGRDSWNGFAFERDELLATVVEKLDGIVILTGDQHWMAVHHLPSGVKEFQTSAVAQTPRAPSRAVPPWVVIQHKALGFGLMDYEPGPPAALTFTAIGNKTESRKDTLDPGVLYEERFVIGRGHIKVRPPSRQMDWLITGAHTFSGFGEVDLERAPPGTYTLQWLPLLTGTAVPEPISKELEDGGAIRFEATSVEGFGYDFMETFDNALAPTWSVVDQGKENSDSNWHIADGVAVEDGNCYDREDKKERIAVPKLGTFLWTPDQKLGDGQLAVRIYAGDNDGFGLMYGIVDAENYYRVSFDIAKKYARWVVVKDGEFELLAELQEFDVLRNGWFRVEVERHGDQHVLRVDGQVLLEGVDKRLGEGGVGLYSWGMDDVRFDDVVFSRAP